MGFNGDYPLVICYIANWKITHMFNGKITTISTGPFSIAMLNYQRVAIPHIILMLFGEDPV